MRMSMAHSFSLVVLACSLVACGTDTGAAAASAGDAARRAEALSWDHVLARITASDATITRISNASVNTTHHGNFTEDFVVHKIVEMEEAASPPLSPAVIAQRNAEVGGAAMDNTSTRLNARHSVLESLITFRPECDGGTCLSFTSDWGWPLSQCLRTTPVNDRIEVVVTDQMPLGGWTYFRFLIRLGADTAAIPPGQDQLISQMWQIHSGPEWRGPIFQANLQGNPTSGFHLVFAYRNDDYVVQNGVKNYYSHEIVNPGGAKNWITPGVWASFHFAMKPVPLPLPGQPAALGALHIFRDQGLAFVPGNGATPINSGNATFNWGYNPVNNGSHPDCSGVNNCVGNKIHMRVGIYRNEAETFNPTLTRTSLMMDSIKATTDENYMPGY